MLVRTASKSKLRLTRRGLGVTISLAIGGVLVCLISFQRNFLTSQRTLRKASSGQIHTAAELSPTITKRIAIRSARNSTASSQSTSAAPSSPMTFSELRQHYHCKSYFRTETAAGRRPTNHSAIWNTMWNIYLQELQDESTGATNHRQLKRQIQRRKLDIDDSMTEDGLQVPYRVAPVGDKGLGLIASRDIPRGTLIFDGRPRRLSPASRASTLAAGRGRAIFDDGTAFRSFVDRLEEYPRHKLPAADRTGSQPAWNMLPCMALQCTAVESTTYPTRPPQESSTATLEPSNSKAQMVQDFFAVDQDDDATGSIDSADYATFREGAFIAVDLQDACFANDANQISEYTVGPLEDSDKPEHDVCGGSPLCDYAVRDIRKGEELAWNYDAYLWGGWEVFGL